MCLTFFVRTFIAGTSAACEVNVCTLGPPVADWDYIRDKLRIHRRESQPTVVNGPATSEVRAEQITKLGARFGTRPVFN